MINYGLLDLGLVLFKISFSRSDTLTMAYKILLIEDNLEMQEAVRLVFMRECELTMAPTIKEARHLLEKFKFDLVLLDLSLPDGDGFKICTYIRQTESIRDTPVIFMSGRAEIEDKEMAFSIGADDYILKPVESRELRARVMARLQRTRQKKEEILVLGNLKFHVALQKVTVVNGVQEMNLDLTANEFKLLYHFVTRDGQVFSRDQLLSAIWGQNINLLERTVDTHVSHLRKKLSQVSADFEITPVRGIGYKCTLTSSIKKAA